MLKILREHIMNILISRKFKLAAVILFFIAAITVFTLELSIYFDTRHTKSRAYSAGTQPISVQPGVIQHVMTILEPIIPSGTVLEVDSKSSKTIQSAIDSAKPGDTVFIKSGIYTESLTLKDGIILRGEDCNSVIIQGDMRVAPVLKIDNCKNVEVSGLTVRHFNPVSSNVSSKGNWPIVKIDNSGAAIGHLIVCESFSDGIRVKNDNVHLDHVLIADCIVYNNDSTGILVLGNGNVELKTNTCADNKEYGICFRDYADGIATGNICKSNSYSGICIQDNAAVETSANTCSENKYVGIWYGSNSPFNVKDNNCFDNGTSGIVIKNQVAVEIAGNHCSRNGVNGIYLMDGVSGSVNGNICSENKWHGVSIAENCAPRVNDNECFKNGKCGIYDDGAMLGYNKIYDNNEFCLQEIQMYLRSEDFDELEKTASQIRKEKRRFNNGNWQLDYFYDAFGISYGSHPFEDNINYCEKWILKYPESITPRIASAVSLYQKGWSIRGRGFSNTVSPEAWEPFEQYLAKALDVLKEAEKLNIRDPALYKTWIDVARGLHKIDDIETAFKKGVEIEPTYYPLYFAHGYTYLPKWYGRPGQYEQLAADAAENTQNEIGQSLYYLLASKMTQQVKDVNEFRESGFDYNRIRQGVKDFAKQFPDFLDIETSNSLCFMACAAGNKEDARDYFMDIGDNWNTKVWQNVETFKKYKAWARNRDEN
jgi:parallel beta-helix repeat protein